MKRMALLAAAALALSGCGLRPLYGGGPDGPVRSTLSAVEVAPIQEPVGLAGGQCTQGPARPTTPARFRLEVTLSQIAGLGVGRDDSVARGRRTLRARYRLIDLSNGNVVLDATTGSDAGIDGRR